MAPREKPHTSQCCTACGKELGYWIVYRLCDVCLYIPVGAIELPVSNKKRIYA